jgi:MscS family membrane protein
MLEFLNWKIMPWDIDLGSLLLATLIFICVLLLRKLFARVILKKLKNIAASSQTVLDDKILVVLEAPLKFLFIVVGFNLAIIPLNFSSEINATITPIIRTLLIFTIFWAIHRCVEPFSFFIDKLTLAFGTELTSALKQFFIKGLKIFIALIGLTAILNEWGINVIGLLASLSLAGAAIALAAKETLTNIFSTLTIILDKMFKPGDWIQTPDVEGVVEEIGSRATKIRTFSKGLVTIPNGTLVNSAVANWSEMTQRRIKMRIGLEYRTSREQIDHIIQRLKNYLQKNPDVETDASKVVTLVYLVEFNTSSIDILLYYFTKTTNWQEWMRIREENMLEFMHIIEEEGASFAFPSQQIYVEKLPKVE